LAFSVLPRKLGPVPGVRHGSAATFAVDLRASASKLPDAIDPCVPFDEVHDQFAGAIDAQWPLEVLKKQQLWPREVGLNSTGRSYISSH
jgi:hypothetical protein